MKKQLIPLLLSLFLSFPSLVKGCDDYIILRIEKIPNDDGTVTVELYADGFEKIEGFQFSLVYNSSSYSLKSPVESKFINNINYSTLQLGLISFAHLVLGTNILTIPNDQPFITFTLSKEGSENLEIKIDNVTKTSPILIPEFINKKGKLCILSNDFLKPNLGPIIQGNVFLDLDNNCDIDASNKRVSEWLINVQTPSKSYNQKVNNEGEFIIIPQEVGTYTITSIPTSDLWANCIETKTFTFDSLTTTNNPIYCDFLAQPKVLDCPKGIVSVNNFLLRRCFNNNYYFINYENQGTEAITNAKIEVQLDEKLNFTSCSVPNFTLTSDNKIIVEIGTLDVMENGNFNLTVEVDCDKSLLGETHCVEAQILPYKDCSSTPYVGPKLDLKAECKNDKIKFTITNIGQQAMSEALEYIVIEDDVMNIRQPVSLQALESHEYTIEATTSTYRMMLPQVKEYKNQTFLTKAIEACGTSTNTNPSLGYITSFPESDEELYIDIFCSENIGSYDPNDISVYPKGFGSSQYILPNTELEYLIRFQNTGTDTAFTVVIKDTIPESLDISTFELKHHSHPVQVTIEKNVLTFTFDNILLLDSFKNEPASHGYLAYTINTVKGLDNKEVNNQAHIYFDYNKPINTNITNQYISSWFLTSTDNDVSIAKLEMNVYPNPSSRILNFENKSGSPAIINIYDSIGKKIKSLTIGNNNETYDVSHLKGIYLCETIFSNKKKEILKLMID